MMEGGGPQNAGAHFKNADLVERPCALSENSTGWCGGSGRRPPAFRGQSVIGEVSDRVVTLGSGSALAKLWRNWLREANMISTRCIVRKTRRALRCD